MPEPVIENTDPGQPNPQEVIRVLQQRFPLEWEVAMLIASNNTLRARLAEVPHNGDDEEADDAG